MDAKETAEQANEIILQILKAANAKSVVKGKSMVSEETELNHHLEQHRIDVLESDLGEFILQLAHEPPSHIVAPAIHKNKLEVAALFQKHFPELPYTEDVDQMTLGARQILRDKFANADAGISGVNFAVAETGTLCLVENEGNGRLSTTAPDLGISVYLSPATIIAAVVVGIVAVAVAPLFLARRIHKMDLPSTLRVVE